MTAQNGIVSLNIMTSLASEDKSLHDLTLLWNLKELTHRCVAWFLPEPGQGAGQGGACTREQNLSETQEVHSRSVAQHGY